MNFDFSYIDIGFYNGSVITVNQDDEIQEAVGIKDRKIVYVGSNQGLKEIADENTQMIDLKGRTLMPGLIDSHFHPILSGFFGTGADEAIIDINAKNCSSIKEIQEKIEEAIKLKKPGEWVSMMGYEPQALEEDRHPTLEDLDKVSPDNPVQCMHRSGHISVYNTRALKELGVEEPKDAEKFPKDEVEVKDGKLTGMVKDHTHFSLWAKVDYTPEQQEKAVMKSHERLLRNGVTSVHDCGECGPSSYKLMQAICKDRTFKVRSYMMIHSIYGKPFALRENKLFLDLGLLTGIGDEYFRFGSNKFMIDGGSSAPSSAMKEPYSHDPDLPGILGWEEEEVADYIKLIHDAGNQVTAHAVGDLAVEFMVRGYEKAQEENPRKNTRHRIEHCTFVDEDQLDRMAKLDILPSVNSGMLVVGGKDYEKFYGPRMKHCIALRSMLDRGMKPTISSDSPSGPLGFATLDGAINRYDRVRGHQTDPSQKISVLEAVRCATLHGAYASFEEDIKGSIEVGKLADLIILSDNILGINPMDINTIKVDMTMIDGNIEYNR